MNGIANPAAVATPDKMLPHLPLPLKLDLPPVSAVTVALGSAVVLAPLLIFAALFFCLERLPFLPFLLDSAVLVFLAVVSLVVASGSGASSLPLLRFLNLSYSIPPPLDNTIPGKPPSILLPIKAPAIICNKPVAKSPFLKESAILSKIIPTASLPISTMPLNTSLPASIIASLLSFKNCVIIGNALIINGPAIAARAPPLRIENNAPDLPIRESAKLCKNPPSSFFSFLPPRPTKPLSLSPIEANQPCCFLSSASLARFLSALASEPTRTLLPSVAVFQVLPSASVVVVLTLFLALSFSLFSDSDLLSFLTLVNVF